MVAAFSDQEGSVPHTISLVVNSVYKEGVNPFLHNLDKKMRGAALTGDTPWWAGSC